MSIDATGSGAYVDLGEAWLRYQTAKLRARHLQFGRRFRLDLETLLDRAASVSRVTRRCEAPGVREHVQGTMVRVIDRCAQLEIGTSARIAEALAD